MKIGVVGAGKLGMTLAQLLLAAGYEVVISSSGSASKRRLIVETLAPGALSASNHEVIAQAEVIILALPLSKFRQFESSDFAGKLVIDAMNYWWEVDGPREAILPSEQSSSEAVAQYFHKARVVKALSHMGYHHLHDEPRPGGASERKAIAVAGDNQDDVALASQIIDAIGFDPLPIGKLVNGWRLEPGAPAFGAHLTRQQLQKAIDSTP